jgi:hypothetical protein
MKAGTTSLWSYLASHPQVFMSDPKELRFFPDDGNWHRGLGWYEQHFAAATAPARGEASPRYAKVHAHPEVPARIAATLPDVKLVYLVREPIARMRSHYLEARRGGWEWRPVERALVEVPDYLETSRYGYQLDAYLGHVPRERILVLRSEDLRDDQAGSLAAVAAFLGVAGRWESPALARERSAKPVKTVYRREANALRRLGAVRTAARLAPRPVRRALHRLGTTDVDVRSVEIPPSLEAELRERLRPDVARLAEIVGPGFGGWEHPSA